VPQKTIAQLADAIAAALNDQPLLSSNGVSHEAVNLNNLIIPLKSGNKDEGSIVFVPGTGGNILYFNELATQLKTNRPCFGIQAVGLYDDLTPLGDLNEIALAHIKAIKDAGLTSPITLIGHSLGAIVVFEMLREMDPNMDVDHVILLDMMAPIDACVPTDFPQTTDAWMLYALRHMERYLQTPLHIDTNALVAASLNEKYALFRQALFDAGVIPESTSLQTIKRFIDVLINNTIAYKNYQVDTAIDYAVSLIKAHDIHDDDFRPDALLHTDDWGWGTLVADVHHYQLSSGDHLSMFAKPTVNELADVLQGILNDLHVEVSYE
jgi:thioesterase domain-containing protein